MNDISYPRREFLKASAMALAAAPLGGLALGAAAANPGAPSQPGFGNAFRFETVNQIATGELDTGYVDMGPRDGPAVVLLHGWPYDIHSFFDVAPLLVDAGYRVLVPHLRGHGTTRFLSDRTARNAQQSVVALDIIALMDALGIKSAILAGYDWGARTANIIAALWPDRCKAMVSANGYLINNLERNKLPLSPEAEHGWWYQFYFATERGKAGYSANRKEFARLIWRKNSPTWKFDDAAFERSAVAFENPDYISIVIHNYRWRLSLESGEPDLDELEQRLAQGPAIAVPTITLDGDADGVVAATDGKAQASKFTGKRTHRIIHGAGHNLPQEAPEAFAAAVIEVDRY